jgi:hypothetical protein
MNIYVEFRENIIDYETIFFQTIKTSFRNFYIKRGKYLNKKVYNLINLNKSKYN